MRGSTILPLLLSISLLFSLEIAGISGNNVFFFDDSNIYVASIPTSSLTRSISLPTYAGDVERGFAFFATSGSIAAYRATSSLSPVESLSVEGQVLGLDAKQGKLYVVHYSEANQTTFISLYSLGNLASSVEFTLLNQTAFDGNVIEVFETPSRKLYFLANDGLYSYDGISLAHLSKLAVSTPPVETNAGILFGTPTGNLVLLSERGLVKNSLSFASGVDAIFLDGGVAKVLTSSGGYRAIDIASFSQIATAQGRDSVALASSSEGGLNYVAYPSAVVRIADGFRDRTPIEGVVDVEVSGDRAVALYLDGGIPKIMEVPSSSGCYLLNTPSEIGYVPVNITGRVWPPISQQVGIRAGTETFSVQTTPQGEFSFLLDPVDLPAGELKVSCIVRGVEKDSFTALRNLSLPKNTFVVSALPQKVEKGESFSFTVRDVVGRELDSFTLIVDGEAREASSPVTLSFSTEGMHTLTLEKEGFEPLSLSVEVPSFPIIPVAIVVLLLLAGVVYFVMSHI